MTRRGFAKIIFIMMAALFIWSQPGISQASSMADCTTGMADNGCGPDKMVCTNGNCAVTVVKILANRPLTAGNQTSVGHSFTSEELNRLKSFTQAPPVSPPQA